MHACINGALLAACGANSNTEASTTSANNAPATDTPAAEPAEPETRSYTDSKGHVVEIPVHAKRVIYTGSDLGDMLSLGVQPIGAALGIIAEQVSYPELLDGITDIGDLLGDAEKIMALEPDLILLDSGGSYYEEGAFDTLSKIAPTITYDRLEMQERLLILEDILGKTAEAEEKLASLEEQATKLKTELGITSDATASVFLQLGKDFYVMGHRMSFTILKMWEPKGILRR